MLVERRKLSVLAVVLAVIGLTMFFLAFQRPNSASAAINSQINFQGKLTNPDGTNVADGTYSVVFSIYSVASGGTAVWTETQSSVTVSAGIFQVQLGSSTALPGSVNFNSSALYLGVKVGSDAEMTPRIQFTAAPYAFNADQLDGIDSTNFVQLAQGLQTDASTTNASIAINKTGTTAKIADFQRGGTSVFSVNNDGSVLVKPTTNSTTAFQVQSSGSINILTTDTSTNAVDIGSNVTDTTQVLLQLDSYNTYADTASCGVSTNQGAMYYNTASATMRVCVNGNWEDMASTGGLGLLAYGVIPDSANAGSVGDLAGITQSNSPCKVYWSGTQQVTVAPCYAYSGGRKITVPLTNVPTSGLAASAFANICLTGSGGAPTLLAGNATETAATLPTWNPNNPILCLATIQASTTAGNITAGKIYDTRTFTNTQKTFATSNTAVSPGYAVIQSGTANLVTTTATALSGAVRGVVVSYSGATSTTTANVILATAGPQYVKATASTIANYVETGTTAGYVNTAATSGTTASNLGYFFLGVATRALDTTCTSNATCQYSQFLNPLTIR